MFRIRKAFENDTTSIYKVEGKITDEILHAWAEGISSLVAQKGRQIVLDFSQLWYISRGAIDVLLKLPSQSFFLLNCPVEMRNVLQTAGISARMLE